jgi:hypothetical protein
MSDRAGRKYAAKVAEAEAAVKGVKDPELRFVAFEKILAHLLEDDRVTSKRMHSSDVSRKRLLRRPKLSKSRS